MKWIKKQVVVEAMLFTDESKQDVINWARDVQLNIHHSWDENKNPCLIVPTLEGDMICSIGDYLIKEPFPTDWRKFYPCKPAIFLKTYEPFSESSLEGSRGEDLEFAKWLEENTIVVKEDKITLYRYHDNLDGWGNYILDDIYTVYDEKYKYEKESHPTPSSPSSGKEAILNKWLDQCFENRLLHFDTIGKIYEAMDEYAASLIKENEQLKISLEMAQLGWSATTDKKDEWANQAKALSAVKKGMETYVGQLQSQLTSLTQSNEAKDKEIFQLKEDIYWDGFNNSLEIEQLQKGIEYWKQRCEAAEYCVFEIDAQRDYPKQYKTWQQLKNQK